MELLQLKYFMVTARYEHMTQASKMLHIAQPALSQSIKRLEDELNVKLFIRSGRNIQLSPSGKFLQKKLAPILDSLDELPREILEVAGVAENTIKLNLLSASELLTKMIIKYKATHPEVHFQLSQDSDSDDWDIRVSASTSSTIGSSQDILLHEEIFLAVPVAWETAGSHDIDLSTIKDAPFISLSVSRPFRTICDEFCLMAGFQANVVFESDSPKTVKDLIGAGLGVAFWPVNVWGNVQSSKVKLLHISNPICKRYVILTQNKKTSSPVIKDFYNYISKKDAHLQL